jgi:hypothetical protein
MGMGKLCRVTIADDIAVSGSISKIQFGPHRINCNNFSICTPSVSPGRGKRIEDFGQLRGSELFCQLNGGFHCSICRGARCAAHAVDRSARERLPENRPGRDHPFLAMRGRNTACPLLGGRPGRHSWEKGVFERVSRFVTRGR